MIDFGGDGFSVVGFILRDDVFYNFFARKSVPEKNLLAVCVGAKSLATRDNFLYSNHVSIISYRFYTSNDDLMIFEILNETVAASII